VTQKQQKRWEYRMAARSTTGFIALRPCRNLALNRNRQVAQESSEEFVRHERDTQEKPNSKWLPR